jgi:vacuolar-type H+-ATPase subunit F/Vma7
VAGRIAAIGEESRVIGFALAGALAVPARSATEVHEAWSALPDDVALVLLTPEAAAALADELADPSSSRLAAVMPP